MLLVADAHVKAGEESESDFRAMLTAISATQEDVIYLGDIMDLWIAIPRYEDRLQKDFLAWCRKETSRRRVFFVEGNHEFFVASRHAGAFTDCSETGLKLGQAWFEHGHQIQGGKRVFNRLFIGLCKSWFGRLVLQCCPFGQAFAHLVQKLMGSKPGYILHEPPWQEILSWREKNTRSLPVPACFLGHFHSPGTRAQDGRICHVLPAWKIHGEISAWNPATGEFQSAPWRELLPIAKVSASS